MEETSEFITVGIPAQRIAMPTPTPIMRFAPAAPVMPLAATFDRAYSGISHFDTPSVLSWSERAVVLTHLARSFYSMTADKRQDDPRAEATWSGLPLAEARANAEGCHADAIAAIRAEIEAGE